MDKVEALYKSTGYPGAARLFALTKKEGISGVKQADIVKFLETQNAASLHAKPADPKRHAIPITTSAGSRDFQMDLLDFQNIKNKGNRGYAWAFIMEDIFNRKAYIEPIKTKSPSDVLPALKNGLEKLGTPMRITSDDGSEWKGEVGKYLYDNFILLDSGVHLHSKMGMIDSFSRYVKNSMGKHFTATQSTNWIDYVPTLLDGYHKTPHSGLPQGMTPNEATDPVNATTVREEANEKVLKARESTKVSPIVVGSRVRILKRKMAFDRGYQVKWSIPIYEVTAIDPAGTYYTLNNGNKYRIFQLHLVKGEMDNEERKEAEPVVLKDVHKQASFEHKTDQILKHKEGVSQSNRREGLRERAPSNFLEDLIYGKIKW